MSEEVMEELGPDGADAVLRARRELGIPPTDENIGVLARLYLAGHRKPPPVRPVPVERVQFLTQRTDSYGQWMFSSNSGGDQDRCRGTLEWYRSRTPEQLGVSPERMPKFRAVERRITEIPLDW